MTLSKSHGYVLVASLGFSFILVFSTLLKTSGMSSLEQVFFRLALASLLLPIILKRKPNLPQKGDLPYFAFTGLVFSVFLLSSLSAIVFNTPIAVVSGLINTQPIFTALFAFMAGNETPDGVKVGLILIGVVGAFLVTGLSFEQVLSGQIGAGVILSIAGGVLYAAYLFLKRRGQTRYKPLDLFFNTLLFAVPFTLLLGATITLLSSNPKIVGFTAPSFYELFLLLLFAGFSTVLPYGLLNKVSPSEVSPTTEGTILLLDPVLHAFWAIIIFQQFVTPMQYFGMLLVLLTAIATLRRIGR